MIFQGGGGYIHTHTTSPWEALKAIESVGICKSVPSTVQFYFGCVWLHFVFAVLFGCFLLLLSVVFLTFVTFAHV